MLGSQLLIDDTLPALRERANSNGTSIEDLILDEVRGAKT